MSYTVSFHHGDTVCREHNTRNQAYVSSQKHIDTEGNFEVWKDVSISLAYQEIFGSAVDEYNQKQKRNDRKIRSYLDSVRKDSRKKECYEIIFQVGNHEQNLGEKSKEILQKFYADFQQRNPQLKVIGAYYHADEFGKCPHVHLDYIPVATGLKKGLSVQNSLTKALEMQGFKTRNEGGKFITAEMQWQNRERSELKKLCENYNLKIAQPEKKPEEYISSQAMQSIRDERMQLKNDALKLMGSIKSINQREQEISRRERIFTVPELEKYISNHGAGESDFQLVENAIIARKSDVLTRFQNLKKNCINLFKTISGAVKKLKQKIAGYEDRPLDSVIADFQNAKNLGYKTFGEYLKNSNSDTLSRKPSKKR